MPSTSLTLKRLFFPGFNLGLRARAKVIPLFLNEPGVRTLDCGCGNGFFTAAAARKGGTALGVSFDAAQIARCNEFKPHLDCPTDRITFRVTDAHEIETTEDRYDQILLLEVIEHIDDDAAVIRRLAMLLKPGGVLHLTTPVSRHGPWIGSLDRLDRGGHVRLGYTDERLQQLIRDAGLDIAYQSRVGTWGVYLNPFQEWVAELLGNTLPAQATAFLIVFPFYLILKFVPIPYSMRMIHHLIGRRSLRSQ